MFIYITSISLYSLIIADKVFACLCWYFDTFVADELQALQDAWSFIRLDGLLTITLMFISLHRQFRFKSEILLGLFKTLIFFYKSGETLLQWNINLLGAWIILGLTEKAQLQCVICIFSFQSFLLNKNAPFSQLLKLSE